LRNPALAVGVLLRVDSEVVDGRLGGEAADGMFAPGAVSAKQLPWDKLSVLTKRKVSRHRLAEVADLRWTRLSRGL